jgi:hypothetical protein
VSKLSEALGPFGLEVEEINDRRVSVSEPLTYGEGAETGVTGLLNSVFELAKVPLDFDPSLGGEAADLERQMRRRKKDELADVLRAYRSVTRLYPDILGTGYGGTPEDFEEFRRVIVPEVLHASRSWAEVEGFHEDAEAMGAVEREWRAAMGEAE